MQRVGAFTALPPLIRQLGVDPIPIFDRAGVPAGAFDDCEARIPYAALGRILHDAAVRTRCAHFGLLAGRVWHLSDLGVVGRLVRNTPTVGQALRTLTVYQHLNSDGAVAFLRETAGVADLGVAIYEPGITGLEQLFNAYMAASINFMRDLCGPAWTPTAVFVPSAKPRDCTHHRHLLHVSPTFNAEFCALRFSAHWLRKAVCGADPALRRLAERAVCRFDAPSLVQQAFRALRVLLLDGRNSGDDVARMLSMHRRTLNRRLREQGATFQGVLDGVRFEVARQLLSSSHIALDDVAASLGYASVSPFMRSFRRWSGITPGEWRRQFGPHEPDTGA
jgi:AraC-like DNA-binding protein